MKARAIGNNFKALRELKSIAKPHLSAGLYVAYPPGLWVRNGDGRNLPSHLKRSKGRLSARPIWWLVNFLVSPFLSFFIFSGSRERTLAVAKGSHAADDFVIFRSDHVFRVSAHSRTEEEIRLRRLWEQWISCSREIPEKSTSAGIAEEFIGLSTSASDAPPCSKRKAISLIADSYSNLSYHSSMGKLADYRKIIEPKLSESAYGEVISHSLRMEALSAFWEQPLVPIGSDNSPDNCLIGEKSFAFIDVEPVYVGFAAQHVLGVIASWDHGHDHQVLLDFLDGDLDEELRQLLNPKMSLDRASRFGYVAIAVLLPRTTSASRWNDFSWRDSLFEAYGLQKHIP